VVRVKNLGGATIEPADYLVPLRLQFPGRQLLTVDVTQSDPPRLQDDVAKHPDFRTERDSITLPMVRLAPDDSFNVVAVLSGTKVGERYDVPVEGRLRSGRITPESTIPWIRRRTIAGVGVTTLATGALAVVLLLNNVQPFTAHPEGLVCVPGSVTVEGSSAFGLAAAATGAEYNAYCVDSTVDVRSPGSIEGLNRLRDAPEAERPRRLAMVDGKQPEADVPGLVPRPLAVVPFTLVVNDKAPVNDLSITQVVEIFTGKVSRWSEVTGNLKDTAEIRVVGRAATSGTRRILERYVLGTNQAAPTSETCDSRRQEQADARAIVCERSTTADVLNRVSAVDYAIGYADVADVRQAAARGAAGNPGRP
jgi:phosphate transport system substrate-binding protein